MKTHIYGRARQASIQALALIILFLIAAPVVPAQAPADPGVPPENIAAGALVIPMDNVNQGNAGGTTFNLRAYGLANLMLQNDVPVKWAIKPGKAKDDTDFTATVTRIAGAAGVDGPATLAFAGGPFVIAREFNTPATRALITTFNTGGTPVTVYETTADALIDIRYTLTHKPKIAIGPDGGGFGGAVFQGLFDRAGIPDYVVGIDDIENTGKCFSLATQGHQENPAFVGTYRSFVQGGGNLILQCASIPTFENHPDGHFQTTPPGYSVFTSNTVGGVPPNEINSNNFIFPEGSMPFNQFLGMLADQDGEVTEFAFAPGAGPANGHRVSVANSGANSDIMVAAVSQLLGPDAIGGVVFEFGGHNYNRPDGSETDTELAMLNGQRMQLNTVFVPAETICTAGEQSVIGYKSVRRFNNRVGGPPLVRGDTLQWTIDYVNNSPAIQFNFQIRDNLKEFDPYLIFEPGSVTIETYNGATASLNPAYDGDGNDGSSDLLAPGAQLPPGGRIQIRLRTLIDPVNTPVPYVLDNQTTGRSDSIDASPSTRSDAIDATNTSIFTEDPPAPDSVNQVQNGSTINPTSVVIAGPTAADISVEGRVVDIHGAGIANAQVTAVNAANGDSVAVRSNALGFFRIENLEAGGLYLITVKQRGYRHPAEPTVVTLSDHVTGLVITLQPQAKAGNTGGTAKAEYTPQQIKTGRTTIFRQKSKTERSLR